MNAARALLPEHTEPEHVTLHRDTIPHDLLTELRLLHREQPDALGADLPAYGLIQLTGGRNNRVYRWSSPRGPVCLKLYRTDKRDRARCEWTALRHLADHGVTATSTALWHDPHPELPAVGLRFVPGRLTTALDMPSTALPAMVTVLGQIRQAPLGPFASLGRLDSATDFIRRITTTWPEQLSQCADESLSRDMIALSGAWHDRGDANVLAEPAPCVFSCGDGNLDNWHWHDVISAIYALDWEFAESELGSVQMHEVMLPPSPLSIDWSSTVVA